MKAERTGELAGMRLPHWLALLRENGRPSSELWPKVLRLTVQSAFNELMFWEEERHLASAISKEQPADPIILTGFPRSGTTFLHQLLCQNQELGYPTTLQVSNPHTFFFLEGKLPGWPARLGRKLYGHWIRFCWRGLQRDWKREVDSVRESLASPSEDEYAMLMMRRSPMLGLTMFRQLEGCYADRYTTLSNPVYRTFWQQAWHRYLQRLSLYWGGRPLVCKSHFHQARISAILELFPRARFVYIHRHPEAVFSSWCHLMSLLRPDLPRSAQSGLFCLLYQRHVGAYLEQRTLLEESQLFEVGYDQLVADPSGTIERLSQRFSLPLSCDGLFEKGYRTNRYPPLERNEQDQISRSLATFYEAFGYDP